MIFFSFAVETLGSEVCEPACRWSLCLMRGHSDTTGGHSGVVLLCSLGHAERCMFRPQNCEVDVVEKIPLICYVRQGSVYMAYANLHKLIRAEWRSPKQDTVHDIKGVCEPESGI